MHCSPAKIAGKSELSHSQDCVLVFRRAARWRTSIRPWAPDFPMQSNSWDRPVRGFRMSNFPSSMTGEGQRQSGNYQHRGLCHSSRPVGCAGQRLRSVRSWPSRRRTRCFGRRLYGADTRAGRPCEGNGRAAFRLDGLVLPTTPIVAPTITEVSASFEAFMAKQLLGFRNTNMINFFDLCAVSLPLPRVGALPVGLMLVARNGRDRKLLRIAAAVCLCVPTSRGLCRSQPAWGQPADLALQAPVKYALVINPKAAEAMGINVFSPTCSPSPTRWSGSP
jgi:Amidase